MKILGRCTLRPAKVQEAGCGARVKGARCSKQGAVHGTACQGAGCRVQGAVHAVKGAGHLTACKGAGSRVGDYCTLNRKKAASSVGANSRQILPSATDRDSGVRVKRGVRPIVR